MLIENKGGPTPERKIKVIHEKKSSVCLGVPQKLTLDTKYKFKKMIGCIKTEERLPSDDI